MKSLTFNLTAIILFALSFMSGLRAEEKKLNVSKGDKLAININYGAISITTWDKNELLIKSDALENKNEKGLEITQKGNTVTVTGGTEGSDIFISAPSDFNFDVRTSAGSVLIKGNVSGKVELRTSGGEIETGNIYGLLDVSTSGGNVLIRNVKGGAKINSGGGDLKAGDIAGDIVLKTGGGNVNVGKVTKSLKLKTGGGNIAVTGTGTDAVINTGGGNILVDKSDGKLELTTGEVISNLIIQKTS
jgi:hypothetical protein